MANPKIEAHRLTCRKVIEALYVAFIDTPRTPDVSAADLAEAAGSDVTAALADLKEIGHVRQSSPAYCRITAQGRGYFNAMDEE
jgi:hypothetical protein